MYQTYDVPCMTVECCNEKYSGIWILNEWESREYLQMYMEFGKAGEYVHVHDEGQNSFPPFV